MKLPCIIALAIALMTQPIILHAQVPGATLALLDPAAVDTSQSGRSTTPDRVTFLNQSSKPVDIYWIDFNGQRMLYRADLAAGSAWTVNTLVAHRWLVVAAGTGARLAGFEALTPNAGDTAIITGMPATAAPSVPATTSIQSAVLPPAQGGALNPLDAATVDDTLRSSNTATPARINFVNQSSGPVDIYWITPTGQRMLYRNGLAVGATWEVRTFLTHPWLVVASNTGGTTARDTGTRLAGFEALTPYGDTAIIH